MAPPRLPPPSLRRPARGAHSPRSRLLFGLLFTAVGGMALPLAIGRLEEGEGLALGMALGCAGLLIVGL